MSVVDPDQKDWRLQVALAIEQPKPRARPPARAHPRRRRRDRRCRVGRARRRRRHARRQPAVRLRGRPAGARRRARGDRSEAARGRRRGERSRQPLGRRAGRLAAGRSAARPTPSVKRSRKSDRAAETVETRTLVVKVGREIRSEFEASIQNSAAELGLDCKIVEHPHLLKVQVAFTVTGPRRKVDEFAAGLNAEEWQSIRTEFGVMSSPL